MIGIWKLVLVKLWLFQWLQLKFFHSHGYSTSTKSLLDYKDIWTMIIVRQKQARAYGLYSSKFASRFEYLYKYHNFL
jgi:hypothetical protein